MVFLAALVAVNLAFADDYLETMRQRELRMMSAPRYAKVQRAELREWALGQRELTVQEVHQLRAARQEAARQTRQLRWGWSPEALIFWRWAGTPSGPESWNINGRSISIRAFNPQTSQNLIVGKRTASEMFGGWLTGASGVSLARSGGALTGAGRTGPTARMSYQR